MKLYQCEKDKLLDSCLKSTNQRMSNTWICPVGDKLIKQQVVVNKWISHAAHQRLWRVMTEGWCFHLLILCQYHMIMTMHWVVHFVPWIILCLFLIWKVGSIYICESRICCSTFSLFHCSSLWILWSFLHWFDSLNHSGYQSDSLVNKTNSQKNFLFYQTWTCEHILNITC